jgi:microcystin-dependent protein
MGREVDSPRTTPGGDPVPDGTNAVIYRKTDLVTSVATVPVSAGKYDHEYDGSYGPIETRVTYGGETRIRDSHSVGQFGPIQGGDLVFLLAGLGSGVLTGVRNELLVTAGGVGRRVLVRNGIGVAAGITYNQFTDNLPSPEFSANASGQPRIDLIGFKVWTSGHAEEGRAELSILEGTAAATPVAPTPTQTLEDGTWFEPLGEVLLASGYSSITAGNITDRRLNAPKGQVPVGAISPFAGATAPLGWRLCDGSAISRTGFAALFTLLGTTYGAGDGSSTFNLPNLKGRVPVGIDAAQTEFDTRGEVGGAKTVTLTAAESGLPAHTHTADAGGTHAHTTSTYPNHDHNYDRHTHSNISRGSGASGNVASFDSNSTAQTGADGSHAHTTDAQGSHSHNIDANAAAAASSAHTNVQPYMALHYIIKT